MKTALIVLAIFVGLTLFIVVIKGAVVLGDVIYNLSEPAVSVTTIEYLKITHPETGLEIEIQGLQSEVDTRLLLLLAGVAN